MALSRVVKGVELKGDGGWSGCRWEGGGVNGRKHGERGDKMLGLRCVFWVGRAIRRLARRSRYLRLAGSGRGLTVRLVSH